MTNAPETNRRHSDRRKPRTEGGIQTIEIEKEGGKKHDVAVRLKTSIPRTKRELTVSWFEEFAIEWSEVFIPGHTKR